MINAYNKIVNKLIPELNRGFFYDQGEMIPCQISKQVPELFLTALA